MWLLEGFSEQRIYLKSNKKVNIGRKNCDILLGNDGSISRLHSSIVIVPNKNRNDTTSVCLLQDEGSKYGTYILEANKYKQITTESYSLSSGDKIRFGLQDHIFTALYIPLVTFVSTLQHDDKIKLQKIMDQIDGTITSNWKNTCTHLTVVKPTLTQKVTMALALSIPIVNIDYWKAVKNAIKLGTNLPEIKDYVPVIDEQLISKQTVSLYPNKMRKTLFSGMIFVHLTPKQLKLYGNMIVLAGGKSMLYTNDSMSLKDLLSENVIVLQYSDNNEATQSTQSTLPEYNTICNFLHNQKSRLIPESEIPLAILQCSTKQYCNPKYNFRNFIKIQKQSNHKLPDTLVLDTQDGTLNSYPVSKLISDDQEKTSSKVKEAGFKRKDYIPETLDSDDNIHSNAINIVESIQIQEDSNSKSQTWMQYSLKKKERHIEKIIEHTESTDSLTKKDNAILSNINVNSCVQIESSKDRIIPIRIDEDSSRTFNISEDVDISMVKCSNQETSLMNSNKKIHYIPETNDSFIITNNYTENELGRLITEDTDNHNEFEKFGISVERDAEFNKNLSAEVSSPNAANNKKRKRDIETEFIKKRKQESHPFESTKITTDYLSISRDIKVKQDSIKEEFSSNKLHVPIRLQVQGKKFRKHFNTIPTKRIALFR